MTNHWNDLQYADVLLVIGANPAENHPISFRWITKAKEHGAKLISVDPRYTRTSQMADIYGQLRSGTDIAFVGGMIKYILDNELYHKEYVASYTNAAYLVADTYNFEDGMFSGYNESTRSYDKKQWAFQTDEEGNVLTDPTLSDPRCVLQLMKKHYERYDVDTVVGVTGTDKKTYLEICKTFAGTGQAGKAGTLLYAMGGTQHTVGSQNVRIFAVLQLLLGNIGISGGGVNALRGESNVQGSTDFGLLYHNVPGYMEVPTSSDTTYQGFLDRITPKSGYWVNKPKFYTSMLKSLYGESATAENEFGYHWMPKIAASKNYSYLRLFDAMYRKELEGMILFGSNPVVGGPHASEGRKSLANLKWLVVCDLWETETAAFWQEEAGSDPKKVQTEVFYWPACGSMEKEGSISNSGRWMQYRWEAIKPKGQSKTDLHILHLLALRLKELYQDSAKPADMPIKALTWNYGPDKHHPDLDLINKEINGYDMVTKQQIKGFGDLKDDGSTCSGNWIYCGFYPGNENLAKRRDNTNEGMSNFLNWAYAWPMNRRILYNRASADLNGKAWSQDRIGIQWDAIQGKWTGFDVPDFVATKGPDDPTFIDPFIMMEGGKGALYSPKMNEGPFPEHYEPYENPISNAFSSVQLNPAVQFGEEKLSIKGDASKYPIIATTYRVSEHWQSGTITRNMPFLAELAPHMFVEISEELAKEKGIKNKDKIIISTVRDEIEAYAMVTKRFKPFKLKDKTVHQIGMIWQYGFKGIAKGAIANRLTPHIGDANSFIPEYKAFLCDVRRAK